MQVVGFYCKKAKKVSENNRVKEIEFTVDKKIGTAALTLILISGSTQIAYAGPISNGLEPIIQILKDLAEPISYGFMVKGFLQLMSGDEHEGLKTVKYAIGGYIGIQWIPMIFKAIKNIAF